MKYDFPVVMKEMYTCYDPIGNEKTIKVPNRMAIINDETKDVLSIVSNRYQLVKHEDIINGFDDIKGITRESVKLSDDGGVMFARYNIDSLEEQEVEKGDMVRFYLRAFNSYNCLTSRGFELFGERLVCLNGMTVPRTIGGISVKHRTSLESGNIVDLLTTYPSEITKVVSNWKEWSNIKPTKEKADRYFKSLELDDTINEDLSNKVTEGNTVWDIYNILTYYTTHQMISRGKNKIFNQRKKSIEYSEKFYKYNWN